MSKLFIAFKRVMTLGREPQAFLDAKWIAKFLDRVSESKKLDWKNDGSIVGKLKYNYGLHCFGRTADEYIESVRRHGFDDIRIQKLEGFDAKYDEELQSQRLLIARKLT
jgi:hypothetical protein